MLCFFIVFLAADKSLTGKKLESSSAKKLRDAERKQLCGVHTSYINWPWLHRFPLMVVLINASDVYEVL